MAPTTFQIARFRQLLLRFRSATGGGILYNPLRLTRDLALAEDRRGSQRFKVCAPLTVILEDREIPTYTRDLSNRGVYFYLSAADSALIESNFQFLVELPPELAVSTGQMIRCKGRLVRKEMNSGNLTETGLAAEILDYSLLGDGR